MKLPPHQLFFSTPINKGNTSFFTGLEEDLSRLRDELSNGSSYGVSGSPGAGKTSLLLRAAEEYDPNAEIILINDVAPSAKEIFEIISQNITALKSKSKSMPALQSAIHKSKKQFILIMDNLDKLDISRDQNPTKNDPVLNQLLVAKPFFDIKDLPVLTTLPRAYGYQAERIFLGEDNTPLLGILDGIIKLHPFTEPVLIEILRKRISHGTKNKQTLESVLDPVGLKFLLSLSAGNPRRLLFLMAEATYRASAAKRSLIVYGDFFRIVSGHLKLDSAHKRIFYLLSKLPNLELSNVRVHKFLELDKTSLKRRLDQLVKRHLVEIDHGYRPGVSSGLVYKLPMIQKEETTIDLEINDDLLLEEQFKVLEN